MSEEERPEEEERPAAPGPDWLALAWNDYFDSLPRLLPLLLLAGLLSAPVYWLVHRYHSYVYALPYALLLVAPLTAGMNMLYIRGARGQKPGLKDLFSAFPVYTRALAVTIWLGTLVGGGALLFVLPGLIMYSIYGFSELLVVDRRCGVREAFSLSAALTENRRLLVGLFGLLLGLLEVGVPNAVYFSGKMTAPEVKLDLRHWALLAFALKSLVFAPWLHFALARIYDDALRQAPPSDS
jgi:uncharacterized membrane protein